MAPGGLLTPTEMRRHSSNYWRLGGCWIISGIIATVIPVAILLMVSES
jgi:hypothetical protein